jgi:hypothetical protein
MLPLFSTFVSISRIALTEDPGLAGRMRTERAVPVIDPEQRVPRARPAVELAERVPEARARKEVRLHLRAQRARRRRADQPRDQRTYLLERVLHAARGGSNRKIDVIVRSELISRSRGRDALHEVGSYRHLLDMGEAVRNRSHSPAQPRQDLRSD